MLCRRKGTKRSLLIASKQTDRIYLLWWWSLPSWTTCFALGVQNPRREDTWEIRCSQSNLKRRCATFNSMWHSPGSNRKFLEFEAKHFEIGISDKHSISCSSKKLCSSSLSIPFVSTMTSHWLQFRTKSCMLDAMIYGTPSDISVAHFFSSSLVTLQSFWIWLITSHIASCEQGFTIQGSLTCMRLLFLVYWFGSNVWIMADFMLCWIKITVRRLSYYLLIHFRTLETDSWFHFLTI